MGYIKKLKNNELVGGTDKTTIYPVTSTEAVFEEVSENNFKSQEYLNNNITGDRINPGTITNNNIADGTLSEGKLDTALKTKIQEGYDTSWKFKGEYDKWATYDAHDVVYDPATNSSYISLQADNQWHPVNPDDEAYVEGWWQIIMNGKVSTDANNALVEYIENDLTQHVTDAITDANGTIQGMIDDAEDALAQATSDANGAAAQAMSVVGNKIADAQIGYFKCETVAGTAIKATLTDTIGTDPNESPYRVPATGSDVKIKMKYANTSTGEVKLQFGSNTATQKLLYYNGAAVSASNTWDAGEVISVYYDGTCYQASNAQGGGGKAEKIKYNNSQSGLAADNVQGALDEIRDSLYESEIINLNNYSTLGQWIRDSDRKWASSTAVNCKLIPISPNTDYIIIPISSTFPSRFCFLRSSAHTIGSIPSFCDGYSQQDVYIREPFRIKSPSSAYYIYFCFQPSDKYNIKLPQQFSVVSEKYASDVEVGNAPDTDLDFTDEIGNVLVRFYEGHIKTKNFDSIDYYGVVDKFKGKHLVIIGDSISTYRGYIPTGWRAYYTNSNLSSVNNTYWMKLCMKLGMTYNNCSYSASRVSGDSTAISVTGAANECAGCSDVRINAINRDGRTPDIVLVYMGTNDWINNVSLGEYNSGSSLPNEGVISTFSPAYALMLAKIRNNYPQAIIFCCTMPTNASKQSAPPFINSQGIAVEDYNSEIRKIASIFGCNVLEFANCGLNYKSIPSLSVDNVLHPNVGGHTLMFKKVLTELISNY